MTAERDRRYGSDPEALAWARDRVEKALAHEERLAAHVDAKGETEKAKHYRAVIWGVRRHLLGDDDGCVVGAFDDRMAIFYATRCVHGHPLDDQGHRCGA